MSQNKPLLSIVIPTKDRYRTLINLVEHLLSWNSTRFEVVIQDNSSNNDAFHSFLDEHKHDNRMKYFHEKDKALTVVENSALSIENSTGKYVCFLGDDDGIISQSLSVVKWMDDNNVDSLNCAHGAYCWPEFRVGNKGKRKSLAGLLLYRGYSGELTEVNPQDSLDQLLGNGALRINNITRLYHGIVSRAVLDKLKAKTGCFFPGPVADMSSAVGLSFYSKKHVFIDYPLITAGASGGSFAGKGAQKKNSTVLENQPWLPKNTIDNWSDFLPKYLTVHTIWPESAVQALIRTQNQKLIQKLNLHKIYGEYLVDHPELQSEFEIFLNQKYTPIEIKALNKEIKKHSLKYRVSKLKYLVKVYAVYFNLHKLVGLKKIEASNIGDAMTLLAKNTNECDWEKVNSKFADILRH